MVSTNVSQTAHDKIAVIGKKARAASLIMAKASSKQKNNVLLTLTDLLGKNLEDLLKANNLDIVEAEKNGLSKAFIDRLTISVDTVAQMAAGLRQIASLRDPIGEITDVRPQPSGIEVGKMRVPLGVVAIIYESRHSVTKTSFRRNLQKCFVRLACVKHAASVHPEPGSNSHVKSFNPARISGFSKSETSSYRNLDSGFTVFKVCFIKSCSFIFR